MTPAAKPAVTWLKTMANESARPYDVPANAAMWRPFWSWLVPNSPPKGLIGPLNIAPTVLLLVDPVNLVTVPLTWEYVASYIVVLQ
jgi:hypothetical protein